MALRNKIKVFYSSLIDSLGYYDRVLDKHYHGKNNLLILMYHRIIPDNSMDPFNLGMCVNTQLFEEQLIYLKNNYNIIKLSDIHSSMSAADNIPKNSIAITFDDGYVDNYEIALPILVKHNIPATMFITTGEYHHNENFWWDRLIHSFNTTSHKKLNLNLTDLKLNKTLSLKPYRIRSSIVKLQELLWQLPIPSIITIINQIESLLDTEIPSYQLRVNSSQIKDIANAGIEIGAHTVTHPNLTILKEDDILSELLNSRTTLENITDKHVYGFAFPGGRLNNNIINLICSAGYSYAVSTYRGVNTVSTNKYSLQRMGMPNTSVADFKRCLAAVAQLNK